MSNTQVPRIVSISGYDRDFIMEHETAYDEVLNEATELFREVVANGGTANAAKETVKYFIATHPLFHPLAALNISGK